MLRLFFELLGAWLMFQLVLTVFRNFNRPLPPPPPPSNIRRDSRPPGDIKPQPRRKADKDDYIDYEEVK